MTDLRTAAQQALEALEWHYHQGHSNTLGGLRLKIDEKALRNLRAALAQQDEPVQEPVAWYQKRGQEVLTSHPACWGREDEPWTPLYTAPPPPQRKPLTEEDVDRICASLGFAAISPAEIVRAVERAHGIGETK